MAHDVFVSHSSKDKPVADAVVSLLESQGIRCWVAPRDILPGMDWGKSIVQAIKGARAMVLIFSANANSSSQINREVERAVNRGIPVIPLRIENVTPDESLEYFISTPHWLDAFTPPLEKHLQYLAQVVRKILELPPPSEPVVVGPGEKTAEGQPHLATATAVSPQSPQSKPETQVANFPSAPDDRHVQPNQKPSGRKTAGIIVALGVVTIAALGVWYAQSGRKAKAPERGPSSDMTTPTPVKISTAPKAEPQLDDQKQADADYRLGVLHQYGAPGIKISSAKAREYYQKAAAHNLPEALASMGFIAVPFLSLSTTNVDVAYEWFAKAISFGLREKVDKGESDSQFLLARMYLEGVAVSKDPVKAVELFQKAADQGNVRAQLFLGIAYASHNGVEEDIPKALDLWKKAAAQRDAFAEFLVGDFYQSGYGIRGTDTHLPQNFYEAKRWYQQAADQGLAVAGYALADLYDRGAGVAKDALQAATLRQAADASGDEFTKGMAQSQLRAQRIMCMNNLKQMGVAFRVWAGDNNDRFPFNTPSKEGGTLEYCKTADNGFDSNSYLHFMVMSNELVSTKVLVCPADWARETVTNFAALKDANVTYLVHTGTNVADIFPTEILAICPLHGNCLWCDGSVQAGTNGLFFASAEQLAKETEHSCINNLRIIDAAKQQWALENKKTSNDTPTSDDLPKYIRGDKLLKCPAGGVYLINAVDKNPTCSAAGHKLP